MECKNPYFSQVLNKITVIRIDSTVMSIRFLKLHISVTCNIYIKTFLIPDLRVKMEPVDRVKMEQMVQEEQPLSSSTVSTGGGGGGNNVNTASNGSAMPTQLISTFKHDPDKSGPDIISASMWTSVQGKLGKAGQVTTPDGESKNIYIVNYYVNGSSYHVLTQNV